MIQVTDCGSVWRFYPVDEAGQDFIDSLGTESWQFMGRALVVDWRMARDIVERFADEVEFVS